MNQTEEFLQLLTTTRKEAASEQLRADLAALPVQSRLKLAFGLKACGPGGDTGWLQQYVGSPLFDTAIQLEQQELELEQARIQKEMAEPRDEFWKMRDALRLQKQQLDLQLMQYEQGQTQAAAAQAPTAPAEAAPAPTGDPSKMAAASPAGTKGVAGRLLDKIRSAGGSIKDIAGKESTKALGKDMGGALVEGLSGPAVAQAIAGSTSKNPLVRAGELLSGSRAHSLDRGVQMGNIGAALGHSFPHGGNIAEGALEPLVHEAARERALSTVARVGTGVAAGGLGLAALKAHQDRQMQNPDAMLGPKMASVLSSAAGGGLRGAATGALQTSNNKTVRSVGRGVHTGLNVLNALGGAGGAAVHLAEGEPLSALHGAAMAAANHAAAHGANAELLKSRSIPKKLLHAAQDNPEAAALVAGALGTGAAAQHAYHKHKKEAAMAMPMPGAGMLDKLRGAVGMGAKSTAAAGAAAPGVLDRIRSAFGGGATQRLQSAYAAVPTKVQGAGNGHWAFGHRAASQPRLNEAVAPSAWGMAASPTKGLHGASPAILDGNKGFNAGAVQMKRPGYGIDPAMAANHKLAFRRWLEKNAFDIGGGLSAAGKAFSRVNSASKGALGRNLAMGAAAGGLAGGMTGDQPGFSLSRAAAGALGGAALGGVGGNVAKQLGKGNTLSNSIQSGLSTSGAQLKQVANAAQRGAQGGLLNRGMNAVREHMPAAMGVAAAVPAAVAAAPAAIRGMSTAMQGGMEAAKGVGSAIQKAGPEVMGAVKDFAANTGVDQLAQRGAEFLKNRAA